MQFKRVPLNNELLLDKEKFIKEILGNDHKGSMIQCAKAFEVTPAYISKIVNNDNPVKMSKFYTGLDNYCKKNNRTIDNFLIPTPKE